MKTKVIFIVGKNLEESMAHTGEAGISSSGRKTLGNAKDTLLVGC